MKAKRRLSNVNVLFISLVDKGANKKAIIWKSAAGDTPTLNKQFNIMKMDEEKRLVYGVVYSPDEVDSYGDTMNAAEIEKMAHSYMAASRTGNVDQQHDYQNGYGFVAESWIVKENDPLFPDQPVGSWVVGIKVTKDETWEAVKAGDIGGISMGGFGMAEDIEKAQGGLAAFLQKTRKALTGLFRGNLVQKDFNEQHGNTILRTAIWSLNDALFEILNDEAVANKKAAIKESIEQFLIFIDKPGDEPMTEEKATPDVAAAGKQEKRDVATIEKQLETLTEKLDSMKSQLEKLANLEKRLAVLEKTHPGQQSANGRDEDGEEAEGGSKGFKFV